MSDDDVQSFFVDSFGLAFRKFISSRSKRVENQFKKQYTMLQDEIRYWQQCLEHETIIKSNG